MDVSECILFIIKAYFFLDQNPGALTAKLIASWERKPESEIPNRWTLLISSQDDSDTCLCSYQAETIERCVKNAADDVLAKLKGKNITSAALIKLGQTILGVQE